MPIIYFKDNFIDESECRISIRDRSFRFGDGIFETMLVVNGLVYDMESHIKRLKAGLQAFRIDFLDISGLDRICASLIRRNSLSEGYVRIIVSRGEDSEGAVGYLPKGSRPYFIVQTVDKPYPQFKPVKLWKSSYKAVLHTTAKTNNALLYTLAMQEASDNGCDNALLLDNGGHICETATGNIFWIADDTLYTPATSLPFVPGTIRNKILGLWKGKSEQGSYTIDAINKASEVFMSNTGVIVAPVVLVEPIGKVMPVGERTKFIRKQLDEEIQRK